ncbi:MAG TPA: M20/M25/M40 family metallo-hydrolase, partial [Acidimicrobiia bacterium]|nr:M20/M25/M40 family metallo-hydrolase [Acidimicrobiia bacterium]
PTTTTTTIPRLDRGDTATIERLQADLDVFLAMGPRVSGSPAEEASAQHFAERATTITGAPARIEEFPLPTGATSWNVWSAEVGSGDRLLVIGSHLDSVAGSPGADDNASGAIVILELLRRLAEEPPLDLRVVIVGFGAEERIGSHGHHFGSRYAVGVLEEQDALPDLMLSVDMVGFGPTLVCVSFQGHDPSFADAIAAVATDADIAIERRTRGEISDHVAFARAGVPAAHLWRDGNPDFHRPGDDHVNDEALLENLRLLEAIVAHLSPPPAPPPSDAGTHAT